MLGKRMVRANTVAARLVWIHFNRYGAALSLDNPRYSLYRQKIFGTYRKCRTVCSCPGCGNPRKHFGEVTLQEKKDRENVLDQVQEFFSAEESKLAPCGTKVPEPPAGISLKKPVSGFGDTDGLFRLRSFARLAV